jgi:hypothetical protein
MAGLDSQPQLTSSGQIGHFVLGETLDSFENPGFCPLSRPPMSSLFWPTTKMDSGIWLTLIGSGIAVKWQVFIKRKAEENQCL